MLTALIIILVFNLFKIFFRLAEWAVDAYRFANKLKRKVYKHSYLHKFPRCVSTPTGFK